ncbi:hypothetical protein [Streptomyces wedmorensis]|uniref:hypothetical protein n=1 Tax=Streptomyces wedmorensis TaxID=43759 RepID=UPI0037B5FB4B
MEAVEVSHETLTRLLAGATTEAALVSGAMCVYRVLPILYWEASPEQYESLARPELWAPETLPDRVAAVLDGLRDGIDSERFAELPEEIEEVYAMASEMILRYFVDGAETGEWADWCSTLILDIHQQLDEILSEGDASEGSVFLAAGQNPDLTPLEEAELGDQISTLVRLGETDPESRRSVLGIAVQGHARTRAALEQAIQSL